ncbi:MAG: pentapeptide repeat-containing protein [Bacteroidota bacterium]
MIKAYFENKTFDKHDFSASPLTIGAYENCIFRNCEFSSADLTDLKFSSCDFVECNLSLAKLRRTSIRDVRFKDCKMLGLLFNNCNAFGLSFRFEGCTLDHSSFFQTKNKKTTFKNCRLNEVDFTECDLSASLFDNCDLMRARFENTILEKADFRTAFNYTINPEINRMKKAKFSLAGIPGLLDQYNIEIEM